RCRPWCFTTTTALANRSSSPPVGGLSLPRMSQKMIRIPGPARSLPLAVLGAVLVCTSCGSDRELEGEGRPTPRVAPETLSEQTFCLPNGLEVELLTGPCGATTALVVHF